MRFLRFLALRLLGIGAVGFAVIVVTYTLTYFSPNGQSHPGIFSPVFLDGLWSAVAALFSLNFGAPLSQFVQSFAMSLALVASAVALACSIGIPVGVWAAVRQRNWFAQGASMSGVLAQAIPPATAAILAQIYIGDFYAGPNPFDSPLILVPITLLAASVVGYVIKFTQAGMFDAMQAGYILSIRARGLSERQIMIRHALRPALIGFITFFGPQMAVMVSTTVVIESVFHIQGLSTFLHMGMGVMGFPAPIGSNQDPQGAATALFILSILIMVMNLGIDILYRALNPRIRF